MRSPSEKRLNLLIALAALATICGLVALAVAAFPGILEAWQRDVGYTEEQLEDVQRLCEAELEEFEGSESYDGRFERCEADEKHRINPDPFSLIPRRTVGAPPTAT